MKCFDHPDQDAVGICIACFKARCRDCIVNHGRTLSCKGPCEHEARRLIDLRDFTLAQPGMQENRMKWANNAQLSGALFALAMGIGLSVWSIVDTQLNALLWMGLLFVFFGIAGLWRTWPRNEHSQFRLCPKCGYNVSHNTSGKCPECGYLV